MSTKVLLAEGLDLIRQAETREFELDNKWEQVKDNLKKMKRDLAKLVHDYESVYRLYITGIEVLNYVRHKVSVSSAQTATQDRQVSELCGAKMVMYMDRCVRLTKKLTKIFVPVDQLSIPMEGFAPGDELIGVKELVLNSKQSSFHQIVSVKRGTYVLTVRYNDDYTFAAPDVEAHLSVTPLNSTATQLESEKVSVKIPCQMGWRRVIGTTGSTIDIEVTANGKRDAHVSVYLNEWHSEREQAPRSPLDHPHTVPVSHHSGTRSIQPVSVRPPGCTCHERLDILQLATSSWPEDSVVAVKLPKDEQRFLQSIFALPLPTELD